MGFLRSADFQNWSTWAALQFNDPTDDLRTPHPEGARAG